MSLISVPVAASGPVMTARGQAALRVGRRLMALGLNWALLALRLSRRLPVEQHAFNIHAQFGHLFKSLRRDEILTVTLRLVFFNPLQLLGSFNKNTADRERIDRSETVLLFTFGSHSAPRIENRKMLPFRVRSARVERIPALDKRQVTCSARRNTHSHATELNLA